MNLSVGVGAVSVPVSVLTCVSRFVSSRRGGALLRPRCRTPASLQARSRAGARTRWRAAHAARSESKKSSVGATARPQEDQQRLGYGIPVESMRAMLEHFRGPLALTAPFRVPSLECRFEAAELSKVRRLPPRLRPSAAWLSRLSADGCRVLQVARSRPH